MVRILLAEDDASHQRLLQSVLKKSNPQIEITVVDTGQDLVRTIREADPGHFDCVVLDYHLPDCDAHELLQQLAGLVREMPAIAISSSSDQRVVIESLRSGTVDFLPKEEAMQDGNLWRSVQRAIENSRREGAERRRLQRRMQHLTRLAETDPLTGLFNRLTVKGLLNDRRRLLDRRGPYSCLMLDLDHFKHVNDTHGHLAGDQVLRAAANILKNAATEEDLTCRWGGEEFLLILRCISPATAMAKAEEIRLKIGEMKIDIGSTHISVTASLGVATAQSNEEFGQQTIEQADAALYLAKHRGRNQVCGWQMVKLDNLLNEVEQSTADSPEDRLSILLRKAGETIGPTQQEHVSNDARRVCEIASQLGSKLDLTEEEMRQVRAAGLFHDVGKLLVPEDILTKPGPLSNEERFLMDFHSSTGAEIGRRLGLDDQTAELIRYHHTRFDSNEEGIGQRTPIGARIIGLADAFVAMTSRRPYQAVKSYPEAVSELKRQRGTQFDPQVVDVASETLR